MLTRWSGLGGALREMEALQRDMDRFFGTHGGRNTALNGRHGLLWAARGTPEVVVRDEGSSYLLTAEVPGLGAEDLEITVTADHVTLSGERGTSAPEGYRAHRLERRPWKFSQSYALPANVDAEAASATVKNGLLTVHLPKVPEVQPRRIAVQAD